MAKMTDEKAKLARDVVAKMLEDFSEYTLKENEEILAFELCAVIEGKDHYRRCGFSVGPYEVIKAKLEYEDKLDKMVEDAVAHDDDTKELPDIAKAVLKAKLRKCLFD